MLYDFLRPTYVTDPKNAVSMERYLVQVNCVVFAACLVLLWDLFIFIGKEVKEQQKLKKDYAIWLHFLQ